MAHEKSKQKKIKKLENQLHKHIYNDIMVVKIVRKKQTLQNTKT